MAVLGTFLFTMHDSVYKYACLFVWVIKGTVSCIHEAGGHFFFENAGFCVMMKMVYFIDMLLRYRSALQSACAPVCRSR